VVAVASHKRTAAAACAVFLASVSLYPFFAGMVWLWAGGGAILAVALAGTAARRRPLPVPVTFLTGLLALLLYLNLAFSNARSLLHLLPTPASLAALWETAGRGFAETAQYAPPVPELRGMVLIAAAGIGISALLTDLIAVTLGSAALAGLPLLLLFTEPFALSVARGFAGTTVAFCLGVIGYLALLSSEGKERIREWERPAPAAREEPDTRALAAAGRRVGFASVVLALCLPLFIPGLHVTRLFGGGQAGIGGSGGSGAGVGFPDPGTQVSSELHTAQASTVLTYTSTSSIPDYLQIYALDRLTANAGWQLFSQPESLVTVSPRLPAVPGLTATSDSATITTQVTVASGVGGDDLGALPVPYPPTSVTAAGTAVRADQATLMVFDSAASLGGLKYRVTSRSEVPSSQLLNTAAPPPASITTPDMYVPGSYDFLLPLAETVVRAAGAKTKFQEAVALQNWLAGGSFAYTLKAPSVLNATELANFLEVTKKGYCQQFSFAMAVLSRLLGIPSRVAYGFTSGALESSGAWLVTTHDAHAWPELYFQGYGWLRFEPTPSGSDGQGTAYAPAYATSQTGGISSGPAPTAAAGQSAAAIGGDQGASLPPNIAERNRQGATGAATRASGAGALNPWQVAGLVLAGLAVLAAVAPWCARRVIRRRRWRRARPGPAALDRVRARDVAWAHAAWNELRDDLTDHGQPWRPSETPRALAARTGASLSLAEPARSALTRIALAEERARYAPTPAEGAGLRADSVTLRRAIAAAAPRRRRWQARLLPASVLVPALGAIAAGADLYRGAWGYRRSRKVR
jgi:transglutaminase-like putative cysteine protease